MWFQSALFLLFWVTMPMIWHVLIKAAGLSLLRPTLPSFLIASLYVFQYLGIPVLYLQLNRYRFEMGVVNPDLVITVWAYTVVTITLLLVGYLVAHLRLGPLRGFSSQISRRNSLSSFQMVSLVALGIICCIVLYVYIDQVGFQNMALLDSLNLRDSDYITGWARSNMGNAFSGKYHWYRLFMRDILSFVWLAIFAQHAIRPSRGLKVILIAFGCALIFSLLMATEKGQLAKFLIAIFLLISWSKYHGQAPVRLLFGFSLVIVGVLTIFYINFMGSAGGLDGVSSVMSRLLTGQIQPAYHYLEFFPAHQDWLWGRSFPNPGGLLPYEPYELTREVMNWKNSALQRHGVAGSSPTVFWGEMYANFGVIGVFVFPPFVGFLLYAGNSVLFTHRPTPVTLAFFIWLLIHYMDLSLTGLSGFIIDTELFVFMALFFMLHRLRPEGSGYAKFK